MICPKCDSMMEIQPKKNTILLVCPDCKHSEENEKALNNLILEEKIEHTEKDKIEIIEIEEKVNITTEMREELTEAYRESMSSQ